MKALLVMALTILAADAGAADLFTLVADGQARARIVTGADAPETVRFAARELQTFVAKMSGAELPIAAQAAPGVPVIRLGPATREVLPPEALKDIRRDGYLIAVAKGDLCIVGLDDAGPQTDIEALLAKGETHTMPAWDFHRGTLYGVYRLLEALGMRWYLPGPFGERAPRSKTLTFSGEIRENPHFISRTVGYWSLWIGHNFTKDLKKLTVMPGERNAIGFTPAENRLWELRMRGATFQIPLNHYPSGTRWPERFGQSHPEYFALLPGGSRSNGNRSEDGHLCYAEPGVVAESVADIRAFAAGQTSEARGISRIHPITQQPMNVHNQGWPDHIAYGDYFSLLPHDGFRPCGCPRCAALISSSGVKDEEHSRLVWDYVARCAAQVPDTHVTCLAYGSYARPYPGMKKLPSNVVVGFCAFSHPASLYHKDTFTQYENAVRAWADLAHGKLAYWQHYLASNRDEETVGIPEHTPEMYARVVRVMAQYGNHAFCEMMADSIMFELFNRYLLMKLFYDPTLDEQELFRDYIQTFYGPDAGPLIAAIYADINAKCIERFRNKSAAYSIWEKLFGEKTMHEYQAKADRALQLARGTLYEPAVAAFRDYYLGLMERGRARYVEPLAYLLASFNPELVSRRAESPLVIDGVPDEAAWKSAVPITLANTVNGKATLDRTEVRTCHDADHIYFAIGAADPAVKTRPRQTGTPGTVDGVEIYLDVPQSRRSYYRIAVDLTGTVHDFHYVGQKDSGPPDWHSRAVAAVVIADGRYEVEVAVPRASLAAPSGDLSTAECGVLVGRTQTDSPRPQDRQSSTSLLLRGRLDQPSYFNTLKFISK